MNENILGRRGGVKTINQCKILYLANFGETMIIYYLITKYTTMIITVIILIKILLRLEGSWLGWVRGIGKLLPPT